MDCNSMFRVLKAVESQWFAMSSGWLVVWNIGT